VASKRNGKHPKRSGNGKGRVGGSDAGAATNDKIEALEPFRENGADAMLTTNHGTRINDNQNSLKGARAGRRCSKTSSCEKRSPTSTTSAFPSASSTRGAPPHTAPSVSTTRCPD
jgi:hypothetical protein